MIMHVSPFTLFRDVHKDGIADKEQQKDICATTKIAMSDGMSMNSLNKDRWKCYKERWGL